MSASPDKTPIFVIKLTPDRNCVDATRSLRRALKVLLRRFGLRCIDARQESAPEGRIQ